MRDKTRSFSVPEDLPPSYVHVSTVAAQLLRRLRARAAAGELFDASDFLRALDPAHLTFTAPGHGQREDN